MAGHKASDIWEGIVLYLVLIQVNISHFCYNNAVHWSAYTVNDAMLKM